MASRTKRTARESKKTSNGKNTKQVQKSGKTKKSTGLSFRALGGCPTTVFDGAVRLDDAASRSFLRTASAMYLMMLDPDCSGVFSPARVAQAYGVFSQNPGRNGRLTCDGFAQNTGNVAVLHVVRRAT
jgi:hypothetical protein